MAETNRIEYKRELTPELDIEKEIVAFLKSATPFPKCYLHKEEWTFDS